MMAMNASAGRTNAGIVMRQSALNSEIMSLRRTLQFVRDALDKALLNNAKLARESEEKTEIILDLKDRIEELEMRAGVNVAMDEFTPVSAIIARVAFMRDVLPEKIIGPSRERRISLARMEAMYEAYRLRHDLGIVALGREFNKCHASLHYAIEQWPIRGPSLGIEVEPILRRDAA